MKYSNQHAAPHILSGTNDEMNSVIRSTEKSVTAWKSILVDDDKYNDWKLVVDQYKTNTDAPSIATNVTVTDGSGRGKTLPLTPIVSEKKMLNTKLSMH
jgi:hypothetical protein